MPAENQTLLKNIDFCCNDSYTKTGMMKKGNFIISKSR